MLINLHSYNSLRYGTLSPSQLADSMLQHGYDTAVLTDINNSSACLQFIQECQARGLNGQVGIEYRDQDELLYIGIAKNHEGFKELNELITWANREKMPLPKRAPDWQHAFVIYPFHRHHFELRDNEYIGVRTHELHQASQCSKKDKERLVALFPITFQKFQHLLHKQLRAIGKNKLITQLGDTQLAHHQEFFIPRDQLTYMYKAVPEIIINTQRMLSECNFNFDFNKPRNKASFTGCRYDDKQLLQTYAMQGLIRRYGPNDKQARERVIKELEIIDRLNFSSYFLITNDICLYAKNQNFHFIGRGSGANSIVAYCLGITDVCPIELNLYFERFLNPKRRNPPDFDIDFSWKDRDQMYDYIFKRYKSQNTALMGAMNTFKGRSIIRELGKIYGLPKEEIDSLIENPYSPQHKDRVAQTILSSSGSMNGLPNGRTIHASGVLISEESLTYYSALDYPPKGLPTVQYDMYLAEDIGFEKFDILSQRGIGHIGDCKEIIRKNRNIEVDISEPKKYFSDPAIAKELKRANTVGCFYIESPAMRQLLKKLRCEDYLTLVAASSIIRPGVASSGMMQTFIERHLNPKKVQYLHPIFQEVLKETYGVMVYQEDVMKIGHHFGGLDLADADVLRRMMSGKYRNKKHLVEIEDKYFAHCKQKGHSEAITKEVWRQMESFAGYSFNKAHSASFAVESYQSLFLKTYYPLEFMVSVLNNYGGFYSREVYINELKIAGGDLHLPCVNTSESNTSILGKDIYLGFDYLLHIEDKLTQLIPQERRRNGKYKSLEDFHLRTGAKLDQMVILIRIGAFRFLGENKKKLLWEVHILLNNKPKRYPTLLTLFLNTSSKKPVLPPLSTTIIEDLYDEVELIGFPVSSSLFTLAKSDYRGDVSAENLARYNGRIVRVVGHLVTWKTVYTKHKAIMKFGTFLDVNGKFIDTVHFPQSLARHPLKGKGLYLIEGKCVVDYGYPTIEVHRCALMPLKPDPRHV